MESAEVELAVPRPYHLGRTFSVLRMGYHDPSLSISANAAQICLATPQGPVTVGAVQDTQQLKVTCLGTGSTWILPRLEALFGLEDHPESFEPQGKLKRLVQQLRGLHLPRLPTVFHRLVQIVLLQLVSWNDGFRSWRLLTARWGSAAPGPYGLRLAPTPEQLGGLAYYDLMQCGILPRQARLILHLAANAKRIERLAAESPGALADYLANTPGIGNWTVQYLLGSALGEADAILLGDYNMPHTVAWYLAGEERGHDARMLELLSPYQGHRFRVISLLWQSGVRAPRHGPRMASNRSRFSPPR